MKTRRSLLGRAAVASALVLGPSGTVATAQESGTLLSQTLTLARTAASPSMEFEVGGGKAANTTTKIVLGIGPDGNTAVPPPNPALPNTVIFRLTRPGSAGTADFTPSGGSNSTAFASKIAVLSQGLEVSNDPSLYVLSVVHTTGTNAVEAWKLEILNLTGARRVTASIDQGMFKTVNPSGACGGSQCPQGQSCQAPCGPSCEGHCCSLWSKCMPNLHIKDLRYLVEIRWPFPPPPCLSCPKPWVDPVPDGFERALVSLTPYVREGEPLGPGMEKEVAVGVTGGEAVGPLVDAGGGQYLQLVQYRRGTTARVRATAAGVSSEEMVVGPEPSGAERTAKTLASVLGVLLVLALAALAVQARRGTPGGAMRA